MTKNSNTGGESGLREDTMPVRYSSHRGGAGLETGSKRMAVTEHGSVISEGLQDVQRPRREAREQQH